MPSPISSPAPAVEFRGVEKRYANGVHALGPLDLRVEPGEFVCLVGPSGCGKSTALRMIAGLASPTAGDVTRAAGADGDVGFVFQEPTLLPWSRLWDNVYLPLRLRRVSRRAAGADVERAIRRVGLGGFEDAFPRQLSGGMQMRVSIARALVTRPSLLLMDEPFAALDEQTRFRLNDDLLALWRDGGWTLVFVTHSVFEAVYLAQRVVVMAPRPGRVVAEVRVDAPPARGPAFRTSTEYGACCRRVSEALAGAAP